jgi:hypothetical protein
MTRTKVCKLFLFLKYLSLMPTKQYFTIEKLQIYIIYGSKLYTPKKPVLQLFQIHFDASNPQTSQNNDMQIYAMMIISCLADKPHYSYLDSTAYVEVIKVQQDMLIYYKTIIYSIGDMRAWSNENYVP